MKLRDLFIGWLTASRYVGHLEAHIEQLRGDMAARMAEKDTLIRQLRLEMANVKAENERMWLVLMPLGSPAGKMYAAQFQDAPPQSAPEPVSGATSHDWQTELNRLLKEEEDGIRSGRRIQEHEPGADDGT